MRVESFPSRRVAWITLLSLIWVVLLASNATPWLRGGFGWRWSYEPVLNLRRIAPFILAVMAYVPVALWLRRRSATGLLVWAVVSCVVLALAAAYVREDTVHRLFTITVAGVPTGWHMAAARISNLDETLRQWPQFMAASGSFSSHMTISPPGMVVIYYAANSILARFPALADALGRTLRPMQCLNATLMAETDAQLASAWLGMLMPVWSSLAILPLYQLGRGVFGQESARWSVLWWPLIPSFLIFTPLPNTFYPLPSLVTIILLLEGLRRNQPGWVVAAGLLMSVLTIMTFTFAPLLLLVGFLTLGVFWTRRTTAHLPWHWPLCMGVWFGLGLSVAWLVLYAMTGAGLWDIWRAAMHAHLGLDRPYWPWLVLHLNDFSMFTGWPLALLASIGVRWVLRKLFSKKELGESDIMILAAGLSLVVLDLSGTLRGESGRILLFLSPWLLLTASSVLDHDQRLGSLLTILQAIVLIVMIVCLRVLDSGLAQTPPSPPYMAEPPANAQVLPSGALFGDVARLKAFSGRIETRRDAKGHEQQVLVVWLDWQPLKPASYPYYLAFLPVAPDGEVATSATLFQPFASRYPTTCWKPCDRELRDRFDVPLFKTQSGDWWVSFALFDAKSLHNLAVVAPDGSHDVQLGLGPFR